MCTGKSSTEGGKSNLGFRGKGVNKLVVVRRG